jgi:hypothetical protein
MGRRRHICWRDGHVLVQGDGYRCLACDNLVQTADKIATTVKLTRPLGLGELTDDRDIATTEDWGHAG